MPKTIVVISTSFPQLGDGSEAAGSFVADFVEELSKYIFVRVVAPGVATVRERTSERVEVYRFKTSVKSLSNLSIAAPTDALQILKILRNGSRAAFAAANGDVVHALACWALPSGWWARKLLYQLKLPYSVWMLGSDVWSMSKIPIVRSVLRNVMRSATHRFADGFELAEASRRICNLDVSFLPSTRKIATKPTIKPQRRAPFRLLFIGRWHHNKGVDLLLDALAQLSNDDWERVASVTILGGGALSGLVRHAASQLIEANRPILVGGFVNKATAEAAITEADYILIPSRVESIPVVFSDAVKLGRPIIAMPVGDLPRLFADSNCGVLAEKISSNAFRDAVALALGTDPGAFTEGLARMADQFNLESIVQRFVSEVVSSEH